MGMLEGLGPIREQSERKDGKDPQTFLQSMVLKQMLMSSGAFKGSDSAGSALHSEMFAEALAEAVTKSGANLFGAGAAPGATSAPSSLATAAVSAASTKGGHPEPRAAAGNIPFAVTAGHITSAYGVRSDPLDGHLAQHGGVDVGAAEGTPIRAAEGGVVKKAGMRGGYGEALEIDHGNGVTTLYGHASELLVREGDVVEKGQTIGKVGHSGRATGNHLHFEVRMEGHAVDPNRALKAYARRADDPPAKEPRNGG